MLFPLTFYFMLNLTILQFFAFSVGKYIFAFVTIAMIEAASRLLKFNTNV